MGKQKPGIMIYWEMFDVLERLKPDKALSAMIAIRQYAQYGREPAFDSDDTLAVVWPIFAQKIAADNDRYIQKCKKATEAINTRWGKPNDTGVYERIPTIPTTTETKTSSSSASKTMTMAEEVGKVYRTARSAGFEMTTDFKAQLRDYIGLYGMNAVLKAVDMCEKCDKVTPDGLKAAIYYI